MKTLSYVSEIGEVVRRERLSLKDREVDFDLVEPARMNREHYRGGIGELRPKAIRESGRSMRAALIDDPEHPSRRRIRLFRHHLGYQTIEGRYPGLFLDAAGYHLNR